MSDYQAGDKVEVRAEIYPAVGAPVFGWHKATVISANNCIEKIYVEFPNGLRSVFHATLVRKKGVLRRVT